MSRRFIEKFIYIAFAAAGLITTIAITVSDFVFGYDTTFIKYGGILFVRHEGVDLCKTTYLSRHAAYPINS